jgi:hypothetical protein
MLSHTNKRIRDENSIYWQESCGHEKDNGYAHWSRTSKLPSVSPKALIKTTNTEHKLAVNVNKT